MCFHLGMTDAFIWDYGTASEKMTDFAETKSILKEIHNEFVKDNNAIQFYHKVSTFSDDFTMIYHVYIIIIT